MATQLEELQIYGILLRTNRTLNRCVDKFGGELYNGSEYEQSNCTSINLTALLTNLHGTTPYILTFGRAFHAYFTPVILIIGLIGNSLSLNVFISKNMRTLSSSPYLAALSIADLMALLFYVLTEWLKKGLPFFPGRAQVRFMDIPGICQLLLYFSYVFRFLSAWLVVAFTVERYIGVCHPLRRRDICTITSSRRIVLILSIVALLLHIFKPALSGVHIVPPRPNPVCASNPAHQFQSFILDSIFAVLITLVPFILITVLNFMIIRKLIHRSQRQKECRVITKESIIRLEFTLILLAVSVCFIVFNFPYFVAWCKQFLNSRIFQSGSISNTPHGVEQLSGILLITKTVFYMNYCVNFFLYSITGAYFRREVRMLFAYRSKRRHSYSKCNKYSHNTQTRHTWV